MTSKKLNQQIVAKAVTLYDASYEKYGDSSDAVHWGNQQSQYLRFFQLIKGVDFQDKDISILDVGCGNGELFKFLHFCGFSGSYHGIDVNESLLSLASKKYKNYGNRVRFSRIDLLNDRFEESFDYVLMSGLFNSDYGQDFAWVCSFIKEMFDKCNNAVIFNALSTHVNFRNDSLYYISPSELINYLIVNISPFVNLVHNIPPYNYQVELRKAVNWDQ